MKRWSSLMLVAAVLAAAPVFSNPSSAGPAAVHDDHPKDGMSSIEDVDRRWWRGDDLLVDGMGSPEGFTIFVARERDKFTPVPVATIRPGNDSDDEWIGYVCVTGNNRFAIVNLAQRWATNRPTLRDRGALLYSVQLESGRVRPLAAGVAFKYHAVGCGRGKAVSYVAHHGVDQAASQLMRGSATGDFKQAARVRGQVTSPIPVNNRVLAVQGHAIRAYSGGKARTISKVRDGVPYGLRANAVGGVDMLVHEGEITSVQRLRGTRIRRLAEGTTGEVALFSGSGDRTLASNVRALNSGVRGFTPLETASAQKPLALSREGQLAAVPAVAPHSHEGEDDPLHAHVPTLDREWSWTATGTALAIPGPGGYGRTSFAMPTSGTTTWVWRPTAQVTISPSRTSSLLEATSRPR